MSCLHPRDIPVYKIEPRQVFSHYDSNGKKVFRSDLVRVKHFIQVPCGHCARCLAERQAQLSFRIEQEALRPDVVSALFVTLTYRTDCLPSDFSLDKCDVQRYLKRLRITLERRYGKELRLRYFLCGEYGEEKGRPHYHAILLFNRSVDWRIIQSTWSKGIVDIAQYTPARGGYVAKYSVKQIDHTYEGRTPPFAIFSKGLGKCFLDKVSPESLRYGSTFTNLSGRKVKLPRYYLNRLYGTTQYFKELYVTDLFDSHEVRRKVRSFNPSGVDYRVRSRFNFYQREQLNIKKSGLTQFDYWKKQTDSDIFYEHNYFKRAKLALIRENEKYR